MHHPFVAWITVPVLLIFGIYAVSRLADGMDGFGAALSRSGRSGSAARRHGRWLPAGADCGLRTARCLDRHLIIGFGLAGVVLGIAAQQSLGNIFRLPRSALRSTFQCG